MGQEAVLKEKKVHSIHKVGIMDIVLWLIMIFVILITLYPMLVMLAGSFSGSSAVMRGEVTIIPKEFTLENYKIVFSMERLWPSYLNTIIYTVVGTVVGVVVTAMTAYPLSKRRFVGRRVFNVLIMFTMLFNGGLIPTYLVVANLLHMNNSIWAIVLPGCCGAWYVILARTFFESIPESLEESAKIDGANDFTILWKIILPLSAPIMATLAMYYAVAQWNNFMGPLIYLRDEAKYPLALFMREVLIQNEGAVGSGQIASSTVKNYTCIIVTSLPIICVYPFIQKYFTQGMMVGAVKG